MDEQTARELLECAERHVEAQERIAQYLFLITFILGFALTMLIVGLLTYGVVSFFE